MMSWVSVKNGEIPAGALVAGYEADGTPLYVARTEHEGGLYPGKASKALGAIHINYEGKEVTKHDYEVLCCNARELSWVHWVRLEKGQPLPERAWFSGKEKDGQSLYVARGKFKGGLHVGKAGNHLIKEGMSVSYQGTEHHVSPYEVLTLEDRLTLPKTILSAPKSTAGSVM